MTKITLTKGFSALIDDEDFNFLSEFKWYHARDRRNHYAVTKIGGKAVSMHRLLFMGHRGLEVDHVDMNGLNNQKSNLRLCTHRQNCLNQREAKSNKSGFKGVSWKKKNQKWVAQIKVRDKVLHLGLFSRAEDAARMYDVAAVKYHGSFAATNEKLGLLKA